MYCNSTGGEIAAYEETEYKRLVNALLSTHQVVENSDLTLCIDNKASSKPLHLPVVQLRTLG